MKTRTLNSLVTLSIAAAFIAACDSPTGPDSSSRTETQQNFPTTYPPVPRPTSVDETIPDQSEIYTALSPIAGKELDFAPQWTDGVFTWDIDVQTQYDRYLGGWTADAPGNYWNGTANSEDLTFENGGVDLRDPTPYGTSYGDPFPRRVMFVEKGVTLATPVNPERSKGTFLYQSYPKTDFPGALFSGTWSKNVDPALGERERRRVYYVAALSCGQLAKPVYVKRERFWVRLPLIANGSPLNSVTVDPGATFEVTYSRTTGTSDQTSYTFTRTISGEIALQTPKQVLGAKLGGSLSEAFGSTVTITDEETNEVTRTMAGIEGKTVVYSVWSSVERYSFVDGDGNPYTDPNFTFEDLGNAEIKGEYEWISGTQFDYAPAGDAAATM